MAETTQTYPGWTGPPEERRAYFVEDRRLFVSGGLGVVYRAIVNTDLICVPRGSSVAVKMFTGDISDDRFEKLRLRSVHLAKVEHPGIARHLEVFVGPPFVEELVDEHDSTERFAVHAWVNGESLADECLESSVGEIIIWGAEVAGALDYLHAHPAGPFAHRDIHPRNVVITDDGHAVLIDFDTIFVEGPNGAVTGPLLAGTRFAPPERRPGMEGAQADDRWSLARTFLYALAADPEGAFSLDQATKAAAKRLAGEAADPRGIVDRLRSVVDGRDPSTAMVLFSGLERSYERRKIIPRLPAKPRHRRLALVAIIAGFGSFALLAILALEAALAPHRSGPSPNFALAHRELIPTSGYPAGFTSLGPGTRDYEASFFWGDTDLAQCLGVPNSNVDAYPVEAAAPQYENGTSVSVNEDVDVFPTSAAARTDESASAKPKALNCTFQDWGPTLDQDLGPQFGPAEDDAAPVILGVSAIDTSASKEMASVRYSYYGQAGINYTDWVRVQKGRSESNFWITSLDRPIPSNLVHTLVNEAKRYMTNA